MARSYKQNTVYGEQKVRRDTKGRIIHEDVRREQRRTKNERRNQQDDE